MSMIDSFPWVPLLTGLTGAIIGALSNAYLRYKADRKNARQELLGLIGVFTEDCMAAIAELQAVACGAKGPDERWRMRAQFQREYGRGTALEIRIFREFRSRRVRAGFHKVLTRLEEFKNLVDSERVISNEQYDMAEGWVRKQLADTLSYAARASQVRLTDRKRAVFVGLRRVTRTDAKHLDFQDGPPPWEFFIDILIKDMDETSKAAAIAHNKAKVEKMRCPQHNRPAHVYFTGLTGSNFTIEVEGCCPSFMQAVHDKLVKARSPASASAVGLSSPA